LYRNYYICYCFHAGLVQLQLIPHVHYIHNATSRNKNSHAIHTNLICTEHSCKWNEINRQTDRQLTQMQMYIGITLITLHVISNLLCQRWPPTLSERAVYTGLELCWRLKQIFISTECAMEYHTSKTIMPYKTPFPSIS